MAVLDEQKEEPVHSHIIGFEREEPRMAGTVEVALRWRVSHDERIRSFANSRPTDGGTHERGLRDGVAAAVTAYARDYRHRRTPARGTTRNPGPPPRRLQQRGPTPTRGRPRPHQPHHPPGQTTAPGAHGPGQLVST
ncbi:hypothetical protein [Streptomyces sp. NPDC059378]|uniref:hypothetical protein n=1 Tax=Streptomyces sp. NPDC059378 TaxID=3346815 RepID=UPI0036CE5953